MRASGATFAAFQRNAQRTELRLFDEDHDLLISRDEAGECGSLAQMFSRLDLDANDTLTQAEYDGFPDLWRRRVITLRDEPEADDG